METNRQKKVAGVLQRDLVDVIQKALMQAGVKNIIVSVSKVNVTTDLSQAKVYLSIFPHDKASEILKGSEDPIQNPDLLPRRKKS